MQAPMAETWLILGRVIRFVPAEEQALHAPVLGAASQQVVDAAAVGEEAEKAAAEEEDAAAVAEEAAQAEEGAAVGEEEAEVAAAHPEEQGEASAAAAQAQLEALVEGVDAALRNQVDGAGKLGAPRFTVSVAPPPQVTFLTTSLNLHFDDKLADRYPYIIAVGDLCLLAHFAKGPLYGTDFSRTLPGVTTKANHRLVLVRYFRRAGGEIMANALGVPDRDRDTRGASLRNTESVGLACVANNNIRIAELNVASGRNNRSLELVVFRSEGRGNWTTTANINSPLVEWDPYRKWIPHGAVSMGSKVMWFDLSWGILACDIHQVPALFSFFRLPRGRELAKGEPREDIHSRRCIAVSGDLLRYVEIFTPDGEAAAAAAEAVSMWSLRSVAGRWRWIANYRVRFQEIWNNQSYAVTGLPAEIPVLTGVCPANPDVVYFDLNQRLFGVNVPDRRVVHWEAHPHQLVNVPEQPHAQKGSSRYLLTWDLQRQDRGVIIGHESPELQKDDFADEREPQDPKGKFKGKSKATEGSASASCGPSKAPRVK